MIGKAPPKGPQTMTRHGQKAAVVVAADDWVRQTSRTGTLADFFALSPLRGPKLALARGKDRLRASKL